MNKRIQTIIKLLEEFDEKGLPIGLIDTSLCYLYKQLMGISQGRFRILTSEFATEFELDDNGDVKTVLTASGKRFDTDLVIICTGVKPNVELLRDMTYN